jgi:peptide/nickel transport system permease protein
MRFFLVRLVGLVVVLFVVSLFTFLLVDFLPGDTTTTILGPLAADEQLREEAQQELNLDDPVWERYLSWLGDALQGDLGESFVTGEPVSESIRERLPTSIMLMVYAQVLALLIAIPLAIISAYRANSMFDKVTTTGSFGVLSIPPFILAIVLIFVFGVRFDVFPTLYDDSSFSDRITTMFLPAFTLAAGLSAVYLRLLRTDMIATLQEDFITMAKAKGMPTRRILLRHALRPSSFSLLTVAGLQVGALIGGALVVEQLFSISGIGTLVTESIFRRDYLVIQGCVLVIAIAYVLINFAVDLLYTVLDPRVRHARAAS